MNKKLYYVRYTIFDNSEWRHEDKIDYILADDEKSVVNYITSKSSMSDGDYYVNYIREATYEEFDEYRKNHK